MPRFPKRIVETLARDKILSIRTGRKPHRFIGIWVVVVENRVFVRSWSLKEHGWFRTALKDPHCTIKVGNKNVAVRAIHTKSSRLKLAVSRAYGKKYNTPGSLIFVRGFRRPKRLDATIELVPS